MIKLIASVVFLFSIVACEATQDSMGKALDNANGVVKSGEKKIYMDAETIPPAGSQTQATPTPTPGSTN